MRKLIALNQLTLDGVMQSPGGPEEDPRLEFKLGGWVRPFFGDGALFQMVYPVVLGKGKRLFEKGVSPRTLTLVDTLKTSKGVLYNTYRSAGPYTP